MTKRIKFRTLLIGGVFTLLFVGLIGKLYWVQVANATFWADHARDTWITSEKIPQERGMLLDRDGKVLAADTAAYTVAVGPKQIALLEKENPDWKLTERIATKLNSVLGTPKQTLIDIINSKKEDGTYRAQREIHPDGWKIDKAVRDKLADFRAELQKLTGKTNVGLYFIEDQKRYYPNGTLASHILGYENKEGHAIIGLEKQFDNDLKGEAGSITYEKDGQRTQLPDGHVEVKQAVHGKNINLTIDRDIQYYIEEALRAAYEEYNPVSITAIAADPKTMEILGMASLPDFNPNKYWDYAKDQVAFKDNALQSVYEPGSTFKIVTLAAAVQEGIFKPNDTYKSGSIKVTAKSRPITDHKRDGWGEISYLDGLKHSSNVAFVKLGYEMLGAEKLRKYIDAFGFGQKTGIELPGESQGAIRFNSKIAIEVATAAFGQGRVLVTPIQQVQAVAAVANGGKLMQPHIIKSISDPMTGNKQITEPEVIREVISESTSRKVGEYLEQVVSDQKIGTGKNAYIPGYRIAGKTGTAQKVIDGKYSDDRYVVSFIGYAPVEDPKIVLYVIVDEPDMPAAGGGSVAAPIFKKIMGQALLHLGVAPSLPQAAPITAPTPSKAAQITATVPDVTGMTVSGANKELRGRTFNGLVVGKGSKVLQQLPKAGSVMPAAQQIYLLTDKKHSTVPDLKGLSLRDALEMCSLLQTPCTVEGKGYVISQKTVKSGGKLTVQLTLAPPGSSGG